MTVAVIIPWREGCEYRGRALEWVRQRWAETHPDWPVLVSCDDGNGAWSKGTAVARGLAGTQSATVVIADADVWAGPIHDAVRCVADGAVPWARPFNRVLRLDQKGTDRVLAGEAIGTVGREPARRLRRPYHHRAAGGLVVLRRADALQIPIDARFCGHGAEDFAWADALDTLLGPRLEGDGVLYHLWHRPQSRGTAANTLLATRYRQAFRKPAAMRALLAEASQ